ncbi:MAG: hypothetical protein M1817_003289 [Caeruleum heppii]|nr:MAG: hypothetical protein M1817_003289 [Caeruleum heppii]
MWLDRFSGHSTPSGSPPPRNRSYSPAPNRNRIPVNNHSFTRPSFNPRSSSLSLNSDVSALSSVGPPTAANGSALRHETVSSTPDDVPDPLEVLDQIVGTSLRSKDLKSSWGGTNDIEENVDFGGLSLQEFADQPLDLEHGHVDVATNTHFIREYDKERSQYEELHRSILGCDNVLSSVEAYLTSFQADLGAVSAEIETLQARSTALNDRLENRKKVEKLLGPALEDISVPPAVVAKISEGSIDEEWSRALVELESRAKAVEKRVAEGTKVKALDDIKPLIERLHTRASERIRDYFVAQIKGLRSPNINAQIIQHQTFLRYKALYAFLYRHQAQLADDIGQAYINTMRWYYLNHFSRYQKALEKMKLQVVDKSDVLGQEDSIRRSAPTSSKSLDPFSLGPRINLLRNLPSAALPSHLFSDSSSPQPIEIPFHNFNLALMDNASSEYTFLTSFFPSPPNTFHQISQKFSAIFQPTFALGQSLTKSLAEATADCLGVLFCVRLNQGLAFELQRRKIPALDGYVNATAMLLWPRFQIVMDLHCESLRRLSSSASASAGSRIGALSLSSLTSASTSPSASAETLSKTSTAPLPLTQRFANFLHSILVMSADAGDDEPVSNSLARLRTELEGYLTKASRVIGTTAADGRRRNRFLGNNSALILSVIEDTHGKLADEQREHFEKLHRATEADA